MRGNLYTFNMMQAAQRTAGAKAKSSAVKAAELRAETIARASPGPRFTVVEEVRGRISVLSFLADTGVRFHLALAREATQGYRS